MLTTLYQTVLNRILFIQKKVFFLFLLSFFHLVLFSQNLIHNFEFNNNFNDSEGTGVSLITSNVASSNFLTGPNAWSWTQPNSPGGGLILRTNLLPNPNSYSVGFRISYQDTGNSDGSTKSYKKILSFKGETDDNGLYFNHRNLEFFPFGANASVTYLPNTFYDFVLTRTAAKEIKVYVVESDGTVTQVYDETDTSDSSVPRLVGGNREFIFFKNDNTSTEHTPGGVVRGIRLWDAPLTQSQIGAALSSVTTGDVTNLSASSATLNGEVNPQGTASNFVFEYGLTTSYGQTIVSTPSSSSASASVDVTANLTGLLPGTLYHYRLKSTNTAGSAFGSDKTFTTSAAGGVPGANLWLDAQNGVTPSSGSLTSWTDQSGNNVFQKFGNPQVQESDINFNKSVKFDGTSDFLNGNTAITFQTIYAVVKRESVSNTDPLISVLLPKSGFMMAGDKMLTSSEQSVLSSFVSAGSLGIEKARIGIVEIVPNQDLDKQKTFIDGKSFSTNAVVGSTIDVFQGAPILGSSQEPLGKRFFDGQIAEVLMFPNAHTDQERIKIQSYLAIKYGINLDQTVNNYVATNGTVVWNNTSYWNDVFGIGKDDQSLLNQSQSNSINTGSGDGTGQTGKGNIVLKSPSSFSDGDFLLIGHDNAALTEERTDLPTSEDGKTRLTREWKVKHTGNVGNVDLTFNLNGICLSGVLNTDYALLIDEDGNGDFTNGSVSVITPTALASGVLTFSGVTLNDNVVFTFAGTPARLRLSSVVDTDNQTKCENTPITDITYKGTNLSGATVTGLPAGVTASFNNVTQVLTISGSATVNGSFNYTVNTTSKQCSTAPSLTGTLTITENETVSAPSATPTVQKDVSIVPITHTTTGATGIGTPTGLPIGVTASWAANTITISGTPTKTGVYNYSIPINGNCGSATATGTITVQDALDSDGDGVLDTDDLDSDNDGILNTDEGFGAVIPARPISTYTSSNSIKAASGPNISSPTNGYIVTDRSTSGKFAFDAVSRSEVGSGAGIGTVSFVTIDVNFAPKETVSNVDVSFKIGSQSSATGNGYFDDGIYIEINNVVIVNFNSSQYGNSAFNNLFDVNGGGWAPWSGEGNPTLELDLLGRKVRLMADTKSGTRQDALPFITNSKPNAIPEINFEKGVTIGTAYNNENGAGGIGIQTLTFSADVATHTDKNGDGIFDYLSPDSDSDGCGDANEAYGAGTDTNGNGQFGATPTLANGGVNANGLVVAAGIAPSTRAYLKSPLDSNNDLIRDYLQLSKEVVSISTQPANTAVSITDVATFSVTPQLQGTGLDPAYQWQEDQGTGTFADITDGGLYSGANTATLSITNPLSDKNGYKYRCIVSPVANVCLNPQTSSAATLTVNKHPIVLVDDSYTISQLSSTATALTLPTSVIANDTFIGALPIINGSSKTTTLTQTGTTVSGITIETTTGNIIVDNTVTPGTYTLSYTLCEDADPTNCQTATITINLLLDTDFDGVADVNDLDDDNDGILDTVEGVCTLPSQMRLGYVANSRDADGDDGYTLDGSNMINSLTRKIQNPANFGPNGIVSTEIILVPISNNPITESLLNSLNLDGLFIGGIDRIPTIQSWLSDSEFAEIQKWSSNAEKTVLVAQASATKWGRILTPTNVNPDKPNAIGAKTRIFDGPFGKVTSFTQGGTFQAIFEADPSKTDVVLAVDSAGDRVIIKDGTYNDILISDIDILTTVGGVSSGDGISNDNDKLALNLIYTMIPLSSCPDSDKDLDGISNSLDSDSDGDSCFDVVEAYGVSADPDNDGIYGTGKPTVDANGLVIAAGVSGNSYTNLPNDINNDGTEDFLQTSNIATSFKTHPSFPATVQSNTDTFLTFQLNTKSTGLPPTYQWQIKLKGTNSWQDLSNTATYNGVAKDTLFLTNVTSSLRDNLYRVKIDNPTIVCGSSFESNSAKLLVTSDPIVANNDNIATSENNTTVLISSILTNDELNAATINNTDVTISTSGSIPSGLTLDLTTGQLATDGTTPIGVYTFDYQICQKIDPTNCTTATISVTILKDTDGDLVADINDLDDDNDGILDTEEGLKTTIVGTAFNTGSGTGNVTGTLSSLSGSIVYNIDFKNRGNTANGGIGNASEFFNNGKEISCAASPTGELNTFNFNPQGSAKLSDLEQVTIDVSYAQTNMVLTFTQPLTNFTLKPGTTGTISANGGTVTITSGNNTAGAGFTANLGSVFTNPFIIRALKSDGNDTFTVKVGASIFDKPDLDGDGILNSLDTDSDNDGCNDVNEVYGANTDTDNNGKYGSGNPVVDANGLVIAAGVTGNVYNTLPSDNDTNGANDFLQASKALAGITTQPVDHLTNINRAITFSATATISGSGTEPTYQWQVNDGGTSSWVDLTDNTNYSGSTTANLVVTPNNSTFNSNQYRVIINTPSYVCDTDFTSNAAVLSIISNIISANNDGIEVVEKVANSAIVNVLTNDLLNSTSALITEVTLSQISTSNAGISLDTSTGNISVTSAVTSGIYFLEYSICENVDPTNCSNGIVTIVVQKDTDGDQIPDATDPDIDNDGNPNSTDPNVNSPTANDDTATAKVGQATEVDILVNDDFLAGTNTTITQSGGTAVGTVSFDNLTGKLTYTPTTAEAGKKVTVIYNVTNTPTSVSKTATVTLTIDNESNLSLSIAANSTTPDVGSNIVFTITATNSGPSNATNVDVKSLLASGFTFVSATPSSGTYDAASGNWFIGNLNNASSETLAITASVNATGLFTQEAEIMFADQTDPDSTPGNGNQTEDDFDKLEITPEAQANIVTILSVDNANPNEGDEITYQIRVTNNGPSTATNVVVSSASIPSGLNYTSDDGSGDFDNSTGIWSVGNIASGNSKTLHITGTVNAGEAGNTISNTIAASLTETDATTTGDVLTQAITINQAALVTTIAVDNSTPNEGDTIKYTITITNNGPNSATGLALTSVLPSGLTYVSDNGSGSYNSATGIWNPSAIAASTSATLEITATVNSGTSGSTISNTVSKIVSDQSATNTLPSASADITVKSINLVTTISVDNSSPNEGGTIKYAITITNSGTDDATNVVLNNSLPTGVTYVSDNGSGAYNASTGVWTVGNITATGTTSLEITATVDNGTAGNHIDNTISSVTATETDATTVGDVLTASITVTSSNLITVVAIPNSTPNVNDTFSYTITVTNNGPGNATGVSLTSLVPAGLTFTSGAATVGLYNNTSGVWTIGDIAKSASATLTVNTTVNSDQGNVTNTITSTAATGNQTDATTSGDVLSQTFTPTSANLITVFSVDNPTPNEGDQVIFTVQVRNAGPSDETNVVIITDSWPISGLTYVSDDSVGAYDSNSGVWTIGNIANGTIATLKITASVNSTTGGSNYIFKANNPASGDQTDLITTGDNLSTSVTVQQAKLNTSIFANNTSPNVGGTVKYTVTVTNNGPSTDNNVSLTSLIPTGLTLVSNKPSQGTYNSGSGLWSIGSLANGDSETLQLTTTVNSGTGGSSITSSITAAVGDHTDTSVSNPNLTTTINVTSANLITVKTVNNPLPDEGDTVIYSINVTNNGPNDETNVSLIDQLPNGVTFVSASASTGTYDETSGVWLIGNITNGDTETLSITATVDVGTNKTTITNTTSAANGDQADPTTVGDVLSANITVTVSDIVTVLTVNNNTPNVGDSLIYTINVTNNGVNDDTNVSLTTDIISNITGLTFVSDDAGADYDETSGVWTIGGILTGETKTLNIVATVGNNTGGSAITFNTSAAKGDQADPTTNGDVLSAILNVTSANLVTTVSIDNSNPNVGDTVKYTINVVNNGPNDETNVTLQDQLPAGITFVSSNTSNGSYSNTTGVWTIGSIPKFNTVSLEVLATIDNGTNGQSITNTISQTATGDQADPTTAGDVLAASLTVSSANLITVISVDNPTPNEGNAIIYSIVVTNNGPNDESNVSLTSLLPLDINFVNATAGLGTYASSTGLWNIGNLTSGSSTTLSIIGTVASGASLNNPITTTTTAAKGNVADTNTAGDVLSVVINVTQSDLVTSISVDNPTPNEGDAIKYTISVTNNGPNNETNASLNTILPTGLTYVSDSGSGAYNNSSGLWSIGNIAKNTTTTLEITATVNSGTGGTSITKTTTAATGDQADPNTTTDVLSSTINIGNFADVVLSKTVDNATPNTGDTINYTISVTNNGPSNVTNLVITDILPSGLTFVNEFAGTGVWDTSASTWTLSSLASGVTNSLIITATVDNDQGGNTIVNTISNTQDQTDSNATPDDISESITVTSVDLFATKTVNNTLPNEGDIVTYSITVTNNTGSSNATNVAITDVLPVGVTYVNSNATNGSYNQGSGLWTIGDLSSGSSALLIIEASINAGTSGTTITNTASNLVSDQSDNNTTSDSLSESLTVSSTDLVTTKTVNVSNPTVGQDVVYTITVTNNAGNDATNVALIDRLPSGVTYKSDDSGMYNTTSGIWTIGNLVAGASETLNITATVNAGAANTTITNTALAATADQKDPTSVGDSLSAIINVTSADLVTVNSVNVTEVNVSDSVVYTLTVTNNGPSDATNVTLIDQLPSDVTYISDTSSGTYDANSGLWTIGSLTSGSSATIDITAQVNASAAGKTVSNIITQTAEATEVDITTVNDVLISTFNVINNDLSTNLTASKLNPNEGDSVIYTLTVTNNGPSTASNVSITDNLPSGVTYSSHTTSYGTFNSVTGLWNIGDLAKNEIATLYITTTVDAGTGGSVITNATTNVSATFSDSNLANNSASVSITVGNEADIVLSNTVDNSTPNVGDTVTFTITALNNGPTQIGNLNIVNTLPTGLTYVNGSTSSGSWTPNNWAIGTLNSGATAILTISAIVDAGTGGKTLTNIVANTQNQTDNNLTQDDFNESITVTSSNLITTKTVNNNSPNEGDTITYTISVTNSGPSDATGVTLTDILPTGVTYVSDNASGSYNTSTGIWSIGNLTNGATKTINIDAVVDAGTAGTSIVNTTSVATGDQTDLITTGDVLSASITVASAELVTTISVDNANPNENDVVTFTILVNNQGPNDATNVSLTSLLPNDLTYDSFTASTGTNYNIGSGLWSIGSITSGDSKELRISAQVNVGTNRKTITTTTTAAIGDQTDKNNVPDLLFVNVFVSNNSDIAITKTVDNATPNVGNVLTYTITVENKSGAEVSNFVLTDILPTGLTFGLASATSGVWSAPNWSISKLSVNDPQTLTLQATVDAGSGGLTLTNTISHTQNQTDTNATVDDLTETVVVTSSNLVSEVTVDNANPNEGDTITLSVNITNNGVSRATNVSLIDVLPTGLTYVSHNTTDGTYNSGSGIWDGLNLDNGDNETLTITATVNSGTGGTTIVNSITAATADQSDPTTVGDITSVSINVTSVNLVTEKTVNNSTPNEGETIIYTINVTNNGPSTATNVSLVDILPNGVTYLTDDSNGTYNPTSGVWSIGSVLNTEVKTLNISATVDLGTGALQNDIINTTTAAVADQSDPTAIGDVLSASITVNSIDLVTTNTVSNSNPNELETIEYSIKVENNGPSTATNVSLTDVLPAGVTYVSDDASGSYNSTTGLWTIGTLVNGETKVLKIQATVDAGTGGSVITNSATAASGTETDSDTTTDTLDAIIIVTSSNLVTTKTVSTSSGSNNIAYEGEVVVFTITVFNDGNSDATDVSLTDVLPVGTTYLTHTVSKGSYNNGSGNWNIGDIQNKEAVTLNISASVDSGQAGNTIINTATKAIGDQSDPTDNGNILSAGFIVDNTTDLHVTKIVDNATPNVGDIITYSITATNRGPALLTNLVITDALPNDLTYGVVTPSVGTWTAPNWQVSSLASGSSATLTIQAIINATGAGKTIVNTITKTHDQIDSEATLDDLTETITVTNAELVTTKTANLSVVNESDIVVYTITVENQGPSDATNVNLTDLLPSGVTYVSDTSNGTYNPGSGLWVLGSVPNGTSKVLTITASVNPGTSGQTITNITTAATGDQSDPDLVSDDLTETITVNSFSDIVLTKVVDNNTPNEGDIVTYTITVTNNGGATATNLVVTDNLPSGLTYNQALPSSGLWNAPNWTVGTLPPGSSETLTLSVLVDPGTLGLTLINTISNSQDQTDTNQTLDDNTESLTVQSSDLEVIKTVSNNSPKEGDTIVYRITVENKGPSDATGVSLEDVLPLGVTYVGHFANTGNYNQATGLWTIGSINNGDTVTLTINATVDANTSLNSITNITSNLTADQGDPDSSNNVGTVTIVPGSSIDLSLTKKVLGNNTSPITGDIVSYEIVVKNDGPNTATGVIVQDLLPTGLKFVRYNSSSIYNETTGEWNVGTLVNGDTKILFIEAEVLSSGDYVNCAEVIAADQNDSDSTPNNGVTTEDDYACAGIVPQVNVDVVVSKTVDNNTPNIGDIITYTIQAENKGPARATGLVITDVLPTGLTLVSATPSEGIWTNPTWNIGNLDSGTIETLTIQVSVDANTGGQTIVNTISKIQDQTDTDDTTDDLDETITVTSSDLAVTKTVSNNSPNESELVTYQITITNNGPDTATNVFIEDVLPVGVTYVSNSTANGTYNPATGLWTIGSINNGDTVTLDINATVNTGTTGLTITNTTSNLTADQSDSDSSNNTGSVSITPGSVVDVAIVKRVLGSTTPIVGDIINYEISVSNAGPNTATGVEVTDVLPSGLRFISYNSSSTYDNTTGLWSVGNVSISDSKVLIIQAEVLSTGDYENCAEVTNINQGDSDVTNNKSCVLITPSSSADLELDMSVNNNNPLVDANIVFTLTLTNNGPSNATNIEVTDLIPTGYAFVRATPSLGSYDNFTGIWSLATLANNTSETLAITVKVLNFGNWINIAEVTSVTESDPDSTPNNSDINEDDYAEISTVSPNIKVTIPQSFSPNGDNINETFEIPNLHVEYPKFRIVIINRYGDKVFDYKHNGNPNSQPTYWNGTSINNGILPSATYFYTIYFNDGNRTPKTGWVYLRR